MSLTPLTPGEQAQVVRSAIGHIGHGTGGGDPWLIAQAIGAHLRPDVLPFSVLQTVQQALTMIRQGAALTPGDTIGVPRQPAIDPSIPQGATYQYQARVRVTAHLPDGSTTDTLVVVPFTGPLTVAQIEAMARAAVLNAQNVNLPPPTFGAAIPTATFTSEIFTIGRNRDF